MKKQVIRLFSLTLASLMLFGCSQSNTSQADDKSSISINGSTDNTDNSDSSSVSETSESSPPDISGDENDPDWIKGEEGFDTFSYDKDEYEIFTSSLAKEQLPDPCGSYISISGENLDDCLKKNTRSMILVKAKITGDSYNYYCGYSGDIQVSDNLLKVKNHFGFCYTPVVIEEVLDYRGFDYLTDVKSKIKKDTVLYVQENMQYINENSYKHIKESLEQSTGYNESPSTKQNIDTLLSYMKRNIDNNVKSVYVRQFPMEKGKSYLIAVSYRPDENYQKGPVVYDTALMPFDLAADEPYKTGNQFLDWGMQYQISTDEYWYQLKEQYGEYFE